MRVSVDSKKLSESSSFSSLTFGRGEGSSQSTSWLPGTAKSLLFGMPVIFKSWFRKFLADLYSLGFPE